VTCAACHDVATAHDALHDGGFTDPGCASCHNANVSAEHADACATCHESTDPDVVAAIAAGDVSCGACHDVASAHDALHDGGFTDPGCASCHNANVSAEHADACATCHESTDPAVVAAIGANNVACGACHNVASAHGSYHVGIVDAYCGECHSGDAVSLHPSCGTCHATTPPAGATCTTCHVGYLEGHPFPLFSGSSEGYNGNHSGYLAWSYVVAQTGATGSPHGNYTTTTTKCAVCHAVHRADPSGVVLTAWGGVGTAVPAFGPTMAPFESCFFCHGTGATFTDKTVEFFVTTSTGVLSPHTTCGRCHTASPHGAGTSEYAVLSSKLINDHADPQLEVDLASGNNGLVPAMFDLSDDTLYGQGLTLATGYLCVGCHGNASNEHVFAVNERGATPAIHYTANVAPGEHAAEGNVTGHQVWVAASSTWSNPGAWYSGGGAHDYYLAIYKYVIGGAERWFKVFSATEFYEIVVGSAGDPADRIGGPYTAADIAAMGAKESTVAFNNAYGCGACHDATRTNGRLAFPHGYVNEAGAPAPKWSNRTEPGAVFDGTTLETSFLWMTIAGDADDPRTLMTTTGANNIDANLDGACLKCHLSGDGSEGVGVTY
jgi:hypothetical protein